MMLNEHDVEGLRRSAAMAPLSPAHVEEPLDTTQRLLAERREIRAVLAELPGSFGEVRAALNRPGHGEV
jgi:hypothetical protein